jgi:hypothetical protein
VPPVVVFGFVVPVFGFVVPVFGFTDVVSPSDAVSAGAVTLKTSDRSVLQLSVVPTST